MNINETLSFVPTTKLFHPGGVYHLHVLFARYSANGSTFGDGCLLEIKLCSYNAHAHLQSTRLDITRGLKRENMPAKPFSYPNAVMV